MRRTSGHNTASPRAGLAARTAAIISTVAVMIGSIGTARAADTASTAPPLASETSVSGEAATSITSEAAGSDLDTPNTAASPATANSPDPDASGRLAPGSAASTGDGLLAPEPASEAESAQSAPPSLDATETGESAVTERAAVPMLAAAANTQGCSYALEGTGTHARTLCWIDFGAGFDTAGKDVSGIPVHVVLDGGYTLDATLSVTGTIPSGCRQVNGTYPANCTRSRYVRSSAFPTWVDPASNNTKGSFLGSSLSFGGTIRPFYTGVNGYPALYQYKENTGGWSYSATTTVSLNSIVVRNSAGDIVNSYEILVADAESTDSGESITWTTTGGAFHLLPNSATSDYGNACSAGLAWSAANTSVTCSSNSNAQKTGTVMLYSEAPANATDAGWRISQRMTGVGLEGVAFAVMFAKAAVNLSVPEKIAAEDSFTLSVKDESGNLVGDAVTTTGDGTTGERSLLIRIGSPSAVTLAVDGVGPNGDQYAYRWSCTTAAGGSYVGMQAPTGSAAHVSAGQILSCTVAAIPPSISLAKTVDNTNVVPVDGTVIGATPDQWTLTAQGASTGSSTSLSGTMTKNAAGGYDPVRRAIRTGTYLLEETSAVQGYENTALSCTTTTYLPDGSTTTSSRDLSVGAAQREVEVATGTSVTCVFVNTAKTGSISWTKADADKPTARLSGATFTLRGADLPAEGRIIEDCSQAPCTGADRDPESGAFSVPDLKWGTYTLTETVAPVGYQLPSPNHGMSFTITGAQLTPEIADNGVILNKKVPVPALPLTGGRSRDALFVGGAGILGLGAVLGAWTSRGRARA